MTLAMPAILSFVTVVFFILAAIVMWAMGDLMMIAVGIYEEVKKNETHKAYTIVKIASWIVKIGAIVYIIFVLIAIFSASFLPSMEPGHSWIN